MAIITAVPQQALAQLTFGLLILVALFLVCWVRIVASIINQVMAFVLQLRFLFQHLQPLKH